MIGATSCFRIKYGKTRLWIPHFCRPDRSCSCGICLGMDQRRSVAGPWYQPSSRDRSPLDDGWQVVPSTDIVVVDATHSKTATENCLRAGLGFR